MHNLAFDDAQRLADTEIRRAQVAFTLPGELSILVQPIVCFGAEREL